MDITYPSQATCELRKSLRPEKNSKEEKDRHASGHTHAGPAEVMLAEAVSVDNGHLRSSLDHAGDFVSEDGSSNLPQVSSNNSWRSAHREKKVSSKYGCKKYMLRSSIGGVRVLRSKRSNGTRNTPPNKNANSVPLSNQRRNRRLKRKEINSALKDEFSRVRKHFRYLLNRMTYEQSLIDAYSGEGWKGQSLEKIRPEKELQRATSEILRRKLEIRELFRHLDTLCAEGKLHESLFDSDGQIYSEDIFCAKCGSKDLLPDNDIILCDGVCDRGFHQMCLEPPLLNEEIPPGDETWLCPGCDCKVDCIDLLNNYLGTKLSIVDKWEKVFPEVAATSAGDRPSDNSSDGLDDNDYDSNAQELDGKALKDCLHTEGSNSTTSSYDSKSSTSDEMHGPTGLSSDDAEDHDYDPHGPDTDEEVRKEGSSSDESDFTSDSEDLGALINDNDPPALAASGEGTSKLAITEKKTVNSELQSILQPNAELVLGKRQRERLDYEKLHDETYGNIPLDSSDDEDWTMNAHKKGKTNGFDKGRILAERDVLTIQNECKSRMQQGKPQPEDGSPKLNLYQPKLLVEGADLSLARPHSSGNRRVKSGPRSFGKKVSQRLCESLRIDIYPSRKTKENLSKELGITVQQVKKWFENARRSLRLSASREGSKLETYASNLGTSLTETSENDVQSKAEIVATNAAHSGVMASQLNRANIFEAECNCREGEATRQSTSDRYQLNATGDVINQSQLNKAVSVDIIECDYRGKARKWVTEELYQTNTSGTGGDGYRFSEADIVATECENRDGSARKMSIERNNQVSGELISNGEPIKGTHINRVSDEPSSNAKQIKGAAIISTRVTKSNGQNKIPEYTSRRVKTRSRKTR